VGRVTDSDLAHFYPKNQTMKGIFKMLVFCQLQITAFSQYIYFNNTYEGNQTGTLQGFLHAENDSYISLGMEDSGISRRTYSLQGDSTSYVASQPTAFMYGAANNPRDMFVKTDGGYISSYANILEFCPESTFYTGYALLNENLEPLWTQTYPEWSICDTLTTGVQGFCKVSDDVTGMFSIMGYNNGHPPPIDSIALRITSFANNDGHIISDHYATLPYKSYYMLQMRCIDGYYYILGNVVFEQTNPLDFQSLLIKVNENAEIVGELEFGNPNGGWEQVPQMEVDHDGNILVAHEYGTNWQVVGLNDWKQDSEVMIRGVQNNVVKQDGQNNYLIVSGVGEADNDIPDKVCVVTKLDQTNQLIWQNIYVPIDYTDPEWYSGGMFDLIQTEDGGYLLSGVSYTLFQKHWLLKLDNCGYEQPSGCPAVIGVDEQLLNEIQLWPDPFHHLLKAVLPQNAQLVFITDMTGRSVFEEKIYYPNQQWNLSFLPDGVYVLNTICEDGRMMAKRVVKR